MERAVILTGGNLGDVRHNLAEARRMLREQVGKEITASSVTESEPWGFTGAPDFLNQVLVFDTALPPEELLSRCLSIEESLGRERESRRKDDAGVAADTTFGAGDVGAAVLGGRGVPAGTLDTAADEPPAAVSGRGTEPAVFDGGPGTDATDADAAAGGAISDGKTYRSRPIDIDILFYGDRIIDTPELTVPHPFIGHREFVLRPLAEIMPGFVHPVLGKTVIRMLEELG